MTQRGQVGQVVTFYSYKGGTGRTMALANVACILAQSYSKRVLAVDWDLEAPGLHRYFQDQLRTRVSSSSKSKEKAIDEDPGLIELLMEMRRLVECDLGISELQATQEMIHSQSGAAACVAKIDFQRYFDDTGINGLQILKAGGFNESYSRNINSFPWEKLYKCSPWVFTALANRLSEMFDFILIDSRTGLTDTSGICTMILPQILVVVFTPNRQSFFGAVQIAEKAARYRRKSPDIRPLLIVPLVSRVEAAKPELRDKWRFGDGQDWGGYQAGFENLFKNIYDLDDVSLKEYFDRIQIKHIPDYAYGEPIAALIEKSDDPFTLKGAYQTFCARMVEGIAPWDLPDDAAVLDVQRQVAERRAEAAEQLAQKAKRTIKRVIGTLAVAGAVVVIVAAIAIPTLLRSRIAANEASAVGSLRVLNTAEITYASTYPEVGYACELGQLGPLQGSPNATPSPAHAALIDEVLASGEKAGYRFDLSCVEGQVSKTPLPAGVQKGQNGKDVGSGRTGVSRPRTEPAAAYLVTAAPISNNSGSRRFCSTQDGVIRQLSGTDSSCAQAKPL